MAAFQRPVALEAQHRTESFRCGILSLDEWLSKHALQDLRATIKDL